MFDDLDKKILNMLISNGRQSSRAITKKLAEEGIRISERGLGKRIARLEREKVILGYTAIIDMKKVNMGVPRLVTVKLSSPKNYVQRLADMKDYLTNAPFWRRQYSKRLSMDARRLDAIPRRNRASHAGSLRATASPH